MSISNRSNLHTVRRAVRTALMLGAATAVIPQFAAAAEPDDIALEEVVVSGTRVVRDGYDAPTPVSVVTAEELQNFATTNVADALNTLPAIAGSTSPQNTQATASSGRNGINALNLRNIGLGRTLVLVNGQRVVASSQEGYVDVNTIPQELIKRVEVVTGGASASWGSDAVGGVVNFILDTEYTGLKASLQGGTTTYGDNQNARFTLTGGTPFADGRGHITFSTSWDRADPIINNTRDWNLEGWQGVVNPAWTADNGQPRILVLDQVASYQGLIGGMIGSGPLMGTAFGPGGAPYQLAHGTLVQSNRYQVGGPTWQVADTRGKHGGQPLASKMQNMGGFLNTSWELNEDTTVSLMLTRNRSQTRNWAFSNEDYNSITILSGNPFIPASVQEAMDANGLESIRLGSMHQDLDIAKGTGDRTVTRVALSADGKFGEGWRWNAYYQYGKSKQAYSTPGVWNTAFLAKAYDAVVDPDTGAIVCRVTLTDPSDPCVPYNPMGIGVNSQAAVNYVQGNGVTQQRLNYMEQNVASFSVDGTPFSLWAGDVSVAAGVEWRKEWMGNGWVDEYSLLGQWWAGNSQPAFGTFNVKEAFLEAVVPLAKDMAFARSADLQAAVRVEDYSTAGTVTAWKLGATWKPVDSVTFRGSLSHDIRAPNLLELYATGSPAGAPFVTDPWQNGKDYSTSQLNAGNPFLTPELSDSWGLGVVLQPTFLPGFGVSVDYWDTKISDAIGTGPTSQEIVDYCYAGQTQYCPLITFEGGVPGTNINTVRRAVVNNAEARYRGLDIESSYRFAPMFMPGNVSLRFVATHYLENSTTDYTGFKIETVGQNTGSVPDWRWSLSADWSNAGWHAGLTARGLSSGVYDNDFIECSSDCPVVPTAQATINVTTNNNHIAGAVYLDGSISKDIEFGDSSKMNVFLNVRNLFNKDPAVVASGATSYNGGSYADTLSPYNPTLYDVLGRVFSAGVRVEF